MAKPVRTTAEADLQILAADAWWRTNRDSSELFTEELDNAVALIGQMPGAGKLYPHPRGVVRRVLMRATEHHVYYVERDDHVLIVAVWGAVRRLPPQL